MVKDSEVPKIAIIHHYEKCTGCHACELICSYYHFKESSLNLSRIIVYKDKATATFIPISCVACPGKPCIKACPTSAIVVNKITGMPMVIEEKCLGAECGLCVNACPYHAIRFVKGVFQYPLICDLCGGDPQCVKVCWPGALEIIKLTPSGRKELYITAGKSAIKINELIKKYEGVA